MEAALRTLEDIPLKGLNLRLQKVEPFLIVVFGIFEDGEYCLLLGDTQYLTFETRLKPFIFL